MRWRLAIIKSLKGNAMKTIECWIVCEKCNNPHYDGNPTGIVFMDKALEEQWIDGKQTLYIERGFFADYKGDSHE